MIHSHCRLRCRRVLGNCCVSDLHRQSAPASCFLFRRGAFSVTHPSLGVSVCVCVFMNRLICTNGNFLWCCAPLKGTSQRTLQLLMSQQKERGKTAKNDSIRSSHELVRANVLPAEALLGLLPPRTPLPHHHHCS